MARSEWRPSEVKFLEAHPNADHIVADKMGRVVAAFYISPYGSMVKDMRAFLNTVADMPVEDVLPDSPGPSPRS